MLRQVGLHICWKFRHRVIRKIAANQFCGSASMHHLGHRGVIPALGINDQGVTHASDTGVPLLSYWHWEALVGSANISLTHIGTAWEALACSAIRRHILAHRRP